MRPEARGGDKWRNERTNERINEQMKVPLCSTGHRPLWGRCPKRKKERKKGKWEGLKVNGKEHKEIERKEVRILKRMDRGKK